MEEEVPKKRGPGRPRKHPLPEERVEEVRQVVADVQAPLLNWRDVPAVVQQALIDECKKGGHPLNAAQFKHLWRGLNAMSQKQFWDRFRNS